MNYFDKIYQFAKQGNEAALRDLLATNNVCIDERKQGNTYITAAFQLAKENDHKAVHLLLKYKANPIPIIQGAAMGGNFEYARAMCKVNGASIDEIAFGAAWGGHLDYARELVDKGAEAYCFIRGAAMGGYFAEADALLQKQRQLHEKKRLNLDAIPYDISNRGKKEQQLIRDVEMCGHFAYGKKLGSTSTPYYARCAAIGEHMGYVEEYLNNNLNDYNLYSEALGAAKSAARGGYCEYAEKLRANKKFFREHVTYDVRNVIAREAARSGYREYAEKLREDGANLMVILDGAKEGGQLDYEQFLTNLKTQSARAVAPLYRTPSGSAVTVDVNLAGTSISQVTPNSTSEVNNVNTQQLIQQIQQLLAEKNAMQQLISAQHQTIDGLNNNLLKQNELLVELTRENKLQQDLIDFQQRNFSQQAPQMPVPLAPTHSPLPTNIAAPSTFFQPVPLTLSQGSLTLNSKQETHLEGSTLAWWWATERHPKRTHEKQEYNEGATTGWRAAKGYPKRTLFEGFSNKEHQDCENERNLSIAVKHEHEDSACFAMPASKVRRSNG